MGLADPTGADDKKPRVFLSYSHVDRPRIALIAQALEAERFEVWWDTLVEGGAAFSRVIADALDASTAVIVVWSKVSIESDWVLDEAMHGRDTKKLIPVSLDGVQPPLGFRQYQTIDLSAWQGDPTASAWLAVLRAIASIAAGERRKIQPDSDAAMTRSRRGFLTSAVVAGLAASGYLVWRGRSTDSVSPRSVAVLPFQNLSGDSTQAYFSDGLADEMRLALSRDAQLQVAARTSSDVFRDRREDAKSIARELRVAYLVDGSVQKSPTAVRIGIALIDAATGFNSWSHTFDKALSDIFALQSEVAELVVKRISAQLSPPRTGVGGTTNLTAFEAYLRGLELYRADAGEASDRAALSSFEAAIAADSNYAAAHAACANSLTLIAQQYAHADELPAMYARAESEARRAIALAPDLPAAYVALANLQFSGRLNIRAARGPYEQALKLGGGEAPILSAAAFYYSQTGRATEATAAIERALTLDPLNANVFRSAGWVAYAARRFGDAIPLLQRALALNTKIANVNASLGDSNLLLGRTAEARERYTAEPAAPFRLAGLAIVEHRLGHGSAAAAAYEELVSELGDSALYQQAQVQAQWQRPDAALALLLRAKVAGDAGLLYSHTDPFLDPLRPDARFQRLQSELGFD